MLCSSIVAHAQQVVKAEKPIICMPINTLLKDLKNKYHEEPMIIGKTTGVDGVVTAVYVNLETGSYTIAEMDEEAACIISVGTKMHYRMPNLGPTM